MQRLRQKAPWVVRLPGLILRVCVLLLLFTAADLALMRLGRLPGGSYFEPVLVLQLFRRLLSFGALSAALVIATVAGMVLIKWRGAPWPRWDELEYGAPLRWLVLVVAFVLTWTYATYDYNQYLGQAHTVDRMLLVLLLPLIAWRSIFVLPYLLVLVPMIGQFEVPIGGFSWSEPVLLIRTLLFVGTAYGARFVTRRIQGSDVLLLLFCMIAAHYWVSGSGKLELNWLRYGNVHYLLPATYANGWWGFVDAETISSWTRRLASLEIPMRLGTIVIECGALFCLWRRLTLRAFLLICVGLHAAIFLVTGIGFWKWVIVDAAVLLLFLGTRGRKLSIFTPSHFVLSIALIATGSLWLRPAVLAWYELPVSYTYRVEAETSRGERYPLPPRFFAPYDYQFTLGHFGYLSREPLLPIVWGTTRSRSLRRQLALIETPEEVFALEAAVGRVRFDPQRGAAFEAVVERTVRGKTRSRAVDRLWQSLAAPSQLWTFPRQSQLPTTAYVRRVTVYEVTSFFDGRTYREIRKRTVRSLRLVEPDGGGPAQSRTD